MTPHRPTIADHGATTPTSGRPHRTLALVGFALVALAGSVTGCGSGPPDRSEVLGRLADTTIVPAYEELATASRDLASAAEALCDAPDAAAVDTAVDALASTRAHWSRTEAMWVGPVMDRRSWAAIDWPIAPDEIEALIDDTTVTLDVEHLGTRIGADQRGLGAVEYLLADGEDADDPAAIASMLEDERRCAYLTAVTAVIADEAGLLPTDWTDDFEDQGPYRDTFATTDGDGLDSLVNDALFLLEAVSDAELGRAIGAMDTDADLDAVEEGPLGLGTADLAAHLAGLRATLVGSGPGGDGADGDAADGVGPLLGDDLWTRLTEQLEAAEEAVAAIDGPLRRAVVDDPATVARARDAIKVVQVTVATEVVSRLGVTIGFSDADGDTGA